MRVVDLGEKKVFSLPVKIVFVHLTRKLANKYGVKSRLHRKMKGKGARNEAGAIVGLLAGAIVYLDGLIFFGTK